MCQGTERKINLIGRDSQIIQGFVNQEIEFFYSKEALLRAMGSHPSQKAATEVGSILGIRHRMGKGIDVGKRMQDKSQYSPHWHS